MATTTPTDTPTSHIGKAGLPRRLKAFFAGTVLVAGLAAALAGLFADSGEFMSVFQPWFGIGMALVVLTQFVLIEGSCPICGMDDDDDLDPVGGADLGVTGKELAGRHLLECKRCGVLIVVEKKSREARRLTPEDVPTATHFVVELPAQFHWPDGAVCCDAPANVNRTLEHEGSSGLAIAANVTAGLLGGAAGRHVARATVGPTGHSVSLENVPMCAAHADEVKLRVSGKKPTLSLPTLVGRQKFLATNPNFGREQAKD